MTVAAISRDGGASATHGELSSKSKYTAPVSRTARSTSERTSAFTPAARCPDGPASAAHVAARGVHLQRSCADARLSKSDADSWLLPDAPSYVKDRPGQ